MDHSFSALLRLALLSAAAIATAPGQGMIAEYRLGGAVAVRGSMVRTLTIARGPVDSGRHWISLAATKGNGEPFRMWLLTAGAPTRANISRYLFQEANARAREYRNESSGEAVLPSSGIWETLAPSITELPEQIQYLGHRYSRDALRRAGPVEPPADAEVVLLQPDLLMGPASNTRQKDETRRYDGSDYELVRLTRDDYKRMRDEGINCVKVDGEQWKWADELGLYYWGGGSSLPFPESLYRSQYLGPALYLDEPAVGTRDHAVRPRLAKDEAFRRDLTPSIMFDEFRKYYGHSWRDGSPATLMKGLRARQDVDLGDMDFRQENLYTWETMVSTAAYQLSQDPRVPEAVVFEPPGRIGTRRTLPEMNMTYGVQFPPDDPKALAGIIYGFLRGAARLGAKRWGTSVYGAFERADAPWWMTHAYDLGASRFFFWDNYQLACVPFGEVLSLARHLRDYAKTHPRPALDQLRQAAEVVILLPPGYDLGHVQTGKGNMWGVGELNLERINRAGVAYRTVMSNFFTEVERCFKLGIPFDLLWDLPGMKLAGYREIVRVREDGKVEVNNQGTAAVLDKARTPARAGGAPPRLNVSLRWRVEGDAMEIHAVARVDETSAKVYYTFGADDEGIYRNALVAWEIYGPDEQDQRVLMPERLKPRVILDRTGGTAEVSFSLNRPGSYRLRAGTVDTTGRTAVIWQPITLRREPGSGKLTLLQNR